MVREVASSKSNTRLCLLSSTRSCPYWRLYSAVPFWCRSRRASSTALNYASPLNVRFAFPSRWHLAEMLALPDINTRSPGGAWRPLWGALAGSRLPAIRSAQLRASDGYVSVARLVAFGPGSAQSVVRAAGQQTPFRGKAARVWVLSRGVWR